MNHSNNEDTENNKKERSLTSAERFPEEITDALDVLGKPENRQALTDLCDTELLEVNQSEAKINHLDALVEVGLARKRVASHTETEINAKYEIREYGTRLDNE